MNKNASNKNAEVRLKNLTPHVINIRTPQGEVTVPPSGTVARVHMARAAHYPTGDPLWIADEDDNSNELPLYTVEPGEVTGLPAREAGVICIVSAMVAAVAERPDVYSPGEVIRDDAGRPVACDGLQRPCRLRGGKGA